MNSETLSLKTIIDELGLQEKTVFIQGNIRKKDLQLFANNLREKISNPRNNKGYYNSYLKKKTQN